MGKVGCSFQACVYIPEVHPMTGVPFHEQENGTHVFKAGTYVTVYAETNHMSANKNFQFLRDIENTALGLAFYQS